MSAMPPNGRKLALSAVRPRNIFTLLLAAACLMALAVTLDGLDLSDVGAAMGLVTPAQWIAAAGATALSFLCVGQYDALFHRFLKTGIPDKLAVLSGASAIAIGQTLGFGLATGTLARWRSLPSLSLPQALKLTNYVSISFMIALGLVTCLAVILSPPTGNGAAYFATLTALVTIAAVALSLLRPAWLPVPLPPLRLMIRLAGLTTLDVALAGLALWVLFPTNIIVEPGMFFSAFVIALGAGLLSGSPGGVGPFELCLITLLPAVPEPQLVAAIVCFRLVYYAIPACLALIVLARPLVAQMTTSTRGRPILRRAEAEGLSRQPNHEIAKIAGQGLHLAEAAQTLVSLGDPATGGTFTTSAIEAFAKEADKRHLWPALYKISDRSAAAARKQGWTVIATSDEAWVDPQAFGLSGSSKRQLRRKLRQSESAGVTVSPVSDAVLPEREMAQVAQEWADRSGGERGFSMGRFSVDHVTGQRCVLAHRNGKLIAFATFHANRHEWVLDLLRSANGTPDGTMHALIVQAINCAQREGIARLSLAAMPRERLPVWASRLAPLQSVQGLRRFKMAFSPRTSVLYLATPNRAILGLAALDIALRICRPTPLHGVSPQQTIAMRFMQIRFRKQDIVQQGHVAHLTREATQHSLLEIER